MIWYLKKKIDKTKNAENVPSLKVDLGQFNLINNKYSQTSEALYTLTPNKSYGYLLNVKAEDLVFLKTYNTEFDYVIIRFTDQNGGPFEIEEKTS